MKPDGPVLRRRDWTVRAVDAAVAERLCMAFHYSAGASKTSVYVHGLLPADAFWDGDARGAALWMPPTVAAARLVAGEDFRGVLSLSRLVVEPGLSKNAAGFLLARSMRLVDRARWPVLVTYADSWRGHTETIYKATGWRDDGLTQPKAVWILNGRMVSPKQGPKTKSAAQMRAAGAVLQGMYAKRRFVHELRSGLVCPVGQSLEKAGGAAANGTRPDIHATCSGGQAMPAAHVAHDRRRLNAHG